MKQFAYWGFFMLLLLFLLCITNSCWVFMSNKNFDKNNQTSKFDKASSEIDTLIRIDGYYINKSQYRLSYLDEGSIIFFNDGSCSCITWKDTPPIYAGIPNKDLKSMMGEYDERVIAIGPKLHHYELCGGLYTIHNDTIFVEYVSTEYPLKELKIKTFRIIDNQTLKIIDNKFVRKNEVINSIHLPDGYDDSKSYWRFVPASNLPSSINMYNKHKRYRWSDKNNWKAYKKIRKKYLKSEKGRKNK